MKLILRVGELSIGGERRERFYDNIWWGVGRERMGREEKGEKSRDILLYYLDFWI